MGPASSWRVQSASSISPLVSGSGTSASAYVMPDFDALFGIILADGKSRQSFGGNSQFNLLWPVV